MQEWGIKMNKDDNCIFCKIIAGEIPSYKVYEDDMVMAILDIQPANRGHVIVLLKNHVPNLMECSDDEITAAFTAAKKIAKALKKVYQCDGVNIMQNNGEAAGQTVFHLHVHVIPRFNEDAFEFEYEKGEVKDPEAVQKEIIHGLE